ncbi:uncharacterized protein LOC131806875 [Musca domestica]|uniref:Regulatory protein zeste n=1 Tax=Musca domestica TaxID=7370 RepID=A0ABM3VCQ3_MUSDO|nr:uncharacterized protein LOC131801072 [Musca domestica]XP_058975099.1 uncharacterized protein LOC131801082 [Musca domestica]XP_058977152.1 uncharacterized protein LOC131801976 [Musca domestica]XP_058978765.1 uncharacterized protein LOC109612715 [Musca domestica]XP_058980663.1 uncharacterized protein LOC131803398 [Musca domestica]XP_058980770.1 uncharacterized protein LOC131803458 [Musca domestica]XP_058983565.1 uncharacterized protein LOC131804552 [Musca domestica]XP_058984262.1 uncharacte
MSKTTNKKQLDILLTSMQLHSDIARGWFKGGKEELNRVWRNLEAELNAAGPPSKSVAEWKKVWADQKKYVRQKAAQNLKYSRGTGGGPNMEQKFSANEEAIYDLVGMKESVEGVAIKYGLGSSTSTIQNPERLPNEILELLEPDGEEAECPAVHSNEDTPQKPPAKKIKISGQHFNTQASARDVLSEEIDIQKRMLDAMIEQQQISKKVYRSIDRLYEVKKEELKEQKRHNLIMEKLRLREVEDKIEKNRRLLELEELKNNLEST